MQFSVLMSVYKKESVSNLKESIDSILGQTLLPDEFVIVEDGKLTKELEECLEEYNRKYSFLKLVKLERNVGLGEALNEGIKNCSYEYIARMDSDDICVKERFEKQLNYIKKNPQIDVVGSNIDEYDINMKNKLSTRKVPEKDNEIKLLLKKRNAFNHMSVIYKKESVLECGNYEDCLFFEDYYLWCKMAKKGKSFYNIQEILIKARAGEDMTKRRGGLKYCKNIINFETKIKKIGFINNFECMKNSIIRIVVSLMPNFLRTKFYKKKLRG